MSVGEKIKCIDPKDSDLSISRQCDLLGLPRSSYYRPRVSTKYEKIFLEEFETRTELITRLKEYFKFYNFERSHQSFLRNTPAEVYWGEKAAKMAA